MIELARCAYIEQRQNIIALGPSGTGKTHIALGLGLAACQKGYKVRFTTAASLVTELMEARDERRMLRHLKQLNQRNLLFIDELGFVPLSKTGAELLIAPCHNCRDQIMKGLAKEFDMGKYEETMYIWELVSESLVFEPWSEEEIKKALDEQEDTDGR